MTDKSIILNRRIRVATIVVIYYYVWNSKECIDRKMFEEILKISGMRFSKKDRDLIFEKAQQVFQNKEEINKYIVDNSKEKQLSYVDKTVLSLLMLGVQELFYNKKVPPKVTINEIIEISKGMVISSQQKYISGVLGSIYARNFSN